VTLTLVVALGGAAMLGALALVPRALVARRQDRMARERMAREGDACRLLTRADLVAGKFRRVPGILGLADDTLSFESLFGDAELLPTSRIQKIVTGSRLASGRRLFRLEVLRITRTSGGDVEFVLSRPSASAWRSHLGLWAMAQRVRDAGASGSVEQVAPGRR
jgi:hypothetical protein